MKSTIRRVATGINETEDGRPLDGIFGKKAVDARVVLSVYKIGTTNTLSYLAAAKCREIAKEG